MPRTDPPAATDVLCEQCGYTLNGLPPDAACPECGLPVVASTTASLRRTPQWEVGGRGAASTVWRVLWSPRQFFRTLDVRDSNRRSRGFSFLFLGIASFISAQTTALHYLLMTGIGAAPEWLPGMALAIPLLLLVTAVLAAVEGRWWGYRLTTPVTRRAMQYLTPHVALAVNLPYLVVLGFLMALAASRDFAIYTAHYLFALSGAVIVAAVYLFRIFMYAMRGIAFANPPGSDPLAATTLSVTSGPK
jgi:hypothetical protein